LRGRAPAARLGLLLALGWAVAATAQPASPPAPVYGYQVVRAYPHDPQAFTEGLFYQDGLLYEATGLEGRSDVRKVRLETGKVLMRRPLAPAYFGEGIVAWKGRLFELTWRSQLGFIYDQASFQPKGTFRYPGEGWALTRDARRLIMSDGTAELRFLDPETLAETGRIAVSCRAGFVQNLNELEWVKGEVWANLWQTNLIARIDPVSGKVLGWIDLTGLLRGPHGPVDVLNGIAYDPVRNRIFVTGKLWPRLYEIRLVPKPAGQRGAAPDC